MESPVSNSFIPQDATRTTLSRRSVNTGGLKDLLMLLSIVLFIASVALAVGMFLYSQYLDVQSSSKAKQIQEAQANFDTSLITNIERLSSRITASESLLNQHLAPSAFFAALDQTTLQTVSFDTLELDATDPSNITIKMTGVAQSMNSIAYQAQIFGQQNVITNPIFSGIDRESDGVHFDLAANINPTAINYSQLLQAAENAAGSTGVAPSAGTSASSTSSAPTQGSGAFGPSSSATTNASSGTAPATPSVPSSGTSQQ